MLVRLALSALHCFEALTRLLGPLLLALAAVLIGGVTWTFFDALMPALGWAPGSLAWCFFTSLGLWLLGNILFN